MQCENCILNDFWNMAANLKYEHITIRKAPTVVIDRVFVAVSAAINHKYTLKQI